MKARLKLSDNSHRQKVWSEDMLFHYLNTILDKYAPEDSMLKLFRNSKSFGPKGAYHKTVLHPFQYRGDWHLAIGFGHENKIVFIDCSDSKTGRFPLGVALGLEEFVEFFGRRIGKSSLKNPWHYARLFQSAAPINAINLLCVALALCTNESGMTKTFCDPSYDARIYDASDFYPMLKGIDRYAYTRSVLGSRFVNRMMAKSRQDTKLVLESEVNAAAAVHAGSETLKSENAQQLEPLPPVSSLYSRDVASNFLDYMDNLEEFYRYTQFIDPMSKMLERLSRDPRTNPELRGAEKLSDYHDWTPNVQPSLYAEYTKKTKMEFDEDKLRSNLSNAGDEPDPVFPLLFENGTACIVCISKDADPNYAHVNVLVVSNRVSTNDRAIYKNYAVRRLVEMYSWQHHRLVKDMKVSLVVLKTNSQYNIVVAITYVLHHWLYHRKATIKLVPDTATLDNYGICLQGLMHSIHLNEPETRDMNYEGMLKYLGETR